MVEGKKTIKFSWSMAIPGWDYTASNVNFGPYDPKVVPAGS
jgi:hypothetical protein